MLTKFRLNDKIIVLLKIVYRGMQMDGYLKVQEVAEKWNITERQVQLLCKTGRISGTIKFGNAWAVPKNAEKPTRLNKK